MRILLTGANGFVGSHVLDALLHAGHEPTLLLRATADTRGIADRIPRCRVCTGSLDDPASLDRACEGAEAVIHCAGRTRAVHAAQFMETNAAGTMRLVRAANAQAAVRRLVLISSLAATGPAMPDRPARDEDVPRPVSAYGRSKLAGETAVREQARMPWTILRPPVVYGPGDRELLPLFRWILAGRRPLLHRPEQPLSVVHAGDLADAVVKCMDVRACYGQTYHVAHPEWTTAGNLATEIAAETGTTTAPLRIPGALVWGVCAAVHLAGWITGKPGMASLWKWPELRAPGWVCDGRRLGEDAGFMPETGLREGVLQTIEAYRDAGWVPPTANPR